MFVFGVLIFFFGVLITCTIKGVSLTVFYIPNVLIPVLASILAVLAATRSFRTFWRGLKAAAHPSPVSPDNESRSAQLKRLLFPVPNVKEDEIGRAASLFRLLSKAVAVISAICVLYSFIQLLYYSGDIDVIGHIIGTILITPLYALMLIAGVFEPAVYVLKKRQAAMRKQKIKIERGY